MAEFKAGGLGRRLLKQMLRFGLCHHERRFLCGKLPFYVSKNVFYVVNNLFFLKFPLIQRTMFSGTKNFL